MVANAPELHAILLTRQFLDSDRVSTFEFPLTQTSPPKRGEGTRPPTMRCRTTIVCRIPTATSRS